MSVVNFEKISNNKLMKILASQRNLDYWADDCGKCEYLKVLHKELHQVAACTQEQEVPNILNKNWAEYRKMFKPILMTLKKQNKEFSSTVLKE